MQRLFSTFPAGRPGLGLLVLRLAVAVTLVNQGRNWLARLPDSGGGDHINSLLAAVGALKIAAAILLLAGFATPLVGVIVALGELGIAFWWMLSPYGGAGFSGTLLAPIFVATIAGALVLLGPGAFSVDARLFGRRELVIGPFENRFNSGHPEPTRRVNSKNP